MKTRRTRALILMALALSILCGCKNTITHGLITKANHECGNHSKLGCTIALKDITKFKWDKVYLFGSWTTSDSISKVIKIGYQGDDVQDDYRRLLFLSNNMVVYEEDFKPFDYYNSTISFSNTIDSLLQAKRKYFTPVTAIFVVEKDKVKGSCGDCYIYTLKPR